MKSFIRLFSLLFTLQTLLTPAEAAILNLSQTAHVNVNHFASSTHYISREAQTVDLHDVTAVGEGVRAKPRHLSTVLSTVSGADVDLTPLGDSLANSGSVTSSAAMTITTSGDISNAASGTLRSVGAPLTLTAGGGISNAGSILSLNTPPKSAATDSAANAAPPSGGKLTLTAGAGVSNASGAQMFGDTVSITSAALSNAENGNIQASNAITLSGAGGGFGNSGSVLSTGGNITVGGYSAVSLGTSSAKLAALSGDVTLSGGSYSAVKGALVYSKGDITLAARSLPRGCQFSPLLTASPCQGWYKTLYWWLHSGYMD